MKVPARPDDVSRRTPGFAALGAIRWPRDSDRPAPDRRRGAHPQRAAPPRRSSASTAARRAGRGDVERLARVARRPARAALPAARRSSRCATGSSRGSSSTAASRTRAPRSTRRAPSGSCSSASRWAAPSRRASPPIRASRRVLGLAPWSPTGSTSTGFAGKRLDVLHGSLDRYLPGVPGVSPVLSRRGFERALARRRRGRVHADPRRRCTGSRCARHWGRPVPLPRARAWRRLVAAS